jgi:NTE family protein
VLLNAVFLDALDSDIERLERINHTLALINSQAERSKTGLRHIPTLAVRPSRDLGELAVNQHEHLPPALRYLLRGLGVTNERGADLLSYIAFAPDYIARLLTLGYRDTLRRGREVERFFAACSDARAA